MNSFKIALKNLSRQKKRTVLLGGAIGFGILFVTLINGFTGSFVSNVGENFSNIMAGHIFVEGKEKLPNGSTVSIIRDNDLIEETIRELDIDYKLISKRSAFQGTLFFEGKSVSQSIVGADWEKDAYFQDRIVLRDGSFDDLDINPQGIIISEDVADLMKVSVGDRVTVKLRTAQGRYNSGYMYISGISADPGLIGAMATQANLHYVNELLGMQPDEYMTLGIYLQGLKYTDDYQEPFYQALRSKLNVLERENEDLNKNQFDIMMDQHRGEDEWEGIRYNISTINDVLAQVQEIVDVLNGASLVILIILFVIIMVGINNTFRIVMYERIREIGTIRALGMQKPEVRNLFLLEAGFIAVLGSLAGFIGAELIMFIIGKINFGMDTPVFILLKNGFITFRVHPLQILLNIVIVVLLTFFAALYPAVKAAKLEPAEALRSRK